MLCSVHFGKSQHFRTVNTLSMVGKNRQNRLLKPHSRRKGEGWEIKEYTYVVGEATFLLSVCRRDGYQIY